jgi:hypothetical protein
VPALRHGDRCDRLGPTDVRGLRPGIHKLLVLLYSLEVSFYLVLDSNISVFSSVLVVSHE